ncbi:DeoR/GlpR family DNA-binding transcription regulator [Lachnospiraceae bacterium LCP25S3_G4]
MLAITRKNKIKDIITERKSITVTELSKQFEVTEETIRRDLKTLEDENFLTRTYGGAFIQSGVENNVTLAIREVAYTESKEIIANQCRQLINNGDSIFLDASTTALFVAKAIRDMRLTVVTNSLLILDQLADCENIRLVSIGGTLSRDYKAFNGNTAVQSLKNYFVDKCFMSCRSLCIDNGVTDSTEGLAAVRHALIEHSNALYIIADYSKFDRTSFLHICGFDVVTGIITDRPLSEDWRNILRKNNTTLYDGQ